MQLLDASILTRAFKNNRGHILGPFFFNLISQSTVVHPHYTYPSNHFKVLLPAEINGFAIEKPLERGAQRRITGHLAWQYDALSHGGVQTQGRHYDPGGFYSSMGEKGRLFVTVCSTVFQ